MFRKYFLELFSRGFPKLKSKKKFYVQMTALLASDLDTNQEIIK